MTKITDEEIQSAFDELSEHADIIKADEDQLDDLIDEELDYEEDEEDEEDVEKAESDNVDEELDNEDEEDEDEDEDEEDVEKAKLKKKKKVKKAIDENGLEDEEVQKAIEVSPFLKGLVNEFEKANQETQSVLGQVASVVNNLTERIENLESDLEKANKEPRRIKSRIAKKQIVDRFEKSNSEDGFDNNSNKTVLGLRTNQREITQVLDEKAFSVEGEMDALFSKALITFEATKTLPSHVLKELKKDGIEIDLRN